MLNSKRQTRSRVFGEKLEFEIVLFSKPKPTEGVSAGFGL